MKCPKCGGTSKRVIPNQYTLHCRDCGGAIKVDLIDPVKLLDLVEKAYMNYTAYTVMYGIKSYLSGDPSALKKLAGVE
jgi:uncharacterized Zn finger protein